LGLGLRLALFLCSHGSSSWLDENRLSGPRTLDLYGAFLLLATPRGIDLEGPSPFRAQRLAVNDLLHLCRDMMLGRAEPLPLGHPEHVAHSRLGQIAGRVLLFRSVRPRLVKQKLP